LPDFASAVSRYSQVLLFTDKNASTVLYKGLSWSYARRLAFGEVRSSEETAALLEQYGVAKMPTLLLVKVRLLLLLD
jgi:protein disulfide-isomerase A6